MFYEQLQAATEEVPTHDMLLIIGDFNETSTLVEKVLLKGMALEVI